MISKVKYWLSVLSRYNWRLSCVLILKAILHIHICTEVFGQLDRSVDLNHKINSLSDQILGVISDHLLRRVSPARLISWYYIDIQLPNRVLKMPHKNNLKGVVYQVGQGFKLIVPLADQLWLGLVEEGIIGIVHLWNLISLKVLIDQFSDHV